MPKSTAAPIATAASPGAGTFDKVLVFMLQRVSRIEQDAAAIGSVLERMRAKSTAAPAAPVDTAASERQRARRPPPKGYKPSAIRVDREPFVTPS